NNSPAQKANVPTGEKPINFGQAAYNDATKWTNYATPGQLWSDKKVTEVGKKIEEGLEQNEKCLDWTNRRIQNGETKIANAKDYGKKISNPGKVKANDDFITRKTGAVEKYRKSKDVLESEKKGLQASKATNSTFSKVVTAIGVALAIYSAYDFLSNPEIGYKSAFFEFLAMELKTFNILVGMIPAAGKVAGLPLAVLDLIFSSEIVVSAINYMVPSMGFLDRWTKGLVSGTTWLGEKVGFRSVANWFFRNEGKQQSEAEKEMSIEKAKHIGFIYSIGATGSAGGSSAFYDAARGATATANGINVYKPNIYLYPEEETPFTATFGTPELLTVTDPDYGEGWSGTAMPDGTLYIGEDEYGFLFYESLTRPELYQYSEGYLIPADDRESTFRAILSGYGLNETEINDFCEFWCEKLDEGADYAMYPQTCEYVDEAMPLAVTPEPDTVFRIWFAFVKDDTPASEAKPETFERNGFTAVEWGGFVIE
ncbi:MAG: hypothetical protein IK093_13835, partial [Ruminiclostridium sp.]|nr:hypothetical protein [Ruminiclostridium sp.]